jgi:hypothetical protein
MLRDKYDWKTRVEVEVEEPEELEWDPRRGMFPNSNGDVEGADVDMNGGGTEDGDGDGEGEVDDGQSSDEEDAVDAMVVGDGGVTPRSVSASTSAGMSTSGT